MNNDFYKFENVRVLKISPNGPLL